MRTYGQGIMRIRCGKPGMQWFWILSMSALCLVINLADDHPLWFRLVTAAFPLFGTVFELTEIDVNRGVITKRQEFLRLLPIWISTHLISPGDQIEVRAKPMWMDHPPSRRPSYYWYQVVLVTSEGKHVRVKDYWLRKDTGCPESFRFARELGLMLGLPVRSEVSSLPNNSSD